MHYTSKKCKPDLDTIMGGIFIDTFALRSRKPSSHELGFDGGQEPGKMNRTKMVFKEFLGNIETVADADIKNLIYYKASTHNYTILVPSWGSY